MIKINELLKLNTEEYKNYITNLTNTLLNDYHSVIREFTYGDADNIQSPFLKDTVIEVEIDKDEIYEMTQGNLLSILIVFSSLNILYNKGLKIDRLEKFMFDPSNPKEFNSALDVIYAEFIEEENIKVIIFECLSYLARVSSKFVSGTVSLYDIYRLQKQDKEFREILNFKLNTEESFATMIDDIKVNLAKLESKLCSKDSCYRPLILSGSGMNMKQASQVFNMIGPKPDIFGNIHAQPIASNFLNGLRNRMDFFINADNARKALIVNFTSVKNSGYLTRILSMLCIDTKLSDIEKCDTPHTNYIKVNIFNENILKKYKHRNMWDEKLQKLRIVGMDRDLIGKTISVASPMTCSAKDGICKTCYGELFKTVTVKKLSDGRVIKDNIGLIAVLLLTEILTQMLLSTKHLLEASTDELNWNGLTDYCDIISNSLVVKEDFSIKDFKILECETELSITKLSVKGNIIELPTELQLNELDYTMELEEEGIYKIIKNSSDDINSPLFMYIVKNNELSGPLNQISSLLNTSIIQDNDISGNINKMLELLDLAGFGISSEHIETIMRELVWTGKRGRITFSTPNPEYEMVRATKKVLEDSVVKSVLFERLEEQLLKLDTYEKNNEKSLLDFLL